MKKITLIAILFIVFNTLSSQPSLDWAYGLYSQGQTSITSSIADSNGNLYVSGVFTNIIDLQGGPGTALYSASGISSNSRNAFIAKYDSQGVLIWTHVLGTDFGTSVTDIKIDFNGDLIVLGGFKGTTDFEPGVGITNIVSNSNTISGPTSDNFLAKYTPSGSLKWVKKYAETNGGVNNRAGQSEFEIDKNNNIYLVGTYSGQVDFDPSIGVKTLPFTGYQYDSYIIKYDSSCSLIWAKSINGRVVAGSGSTTSGRPGISDIAFDKSGNIILTGTLSYSVDFDPGPLDYIITSSSYYAGKSDYFLAKYNDTLGFIWANVFGDILNREYTTDLKVDSSNNIYLASMGSGTFDLDPSINVQNFNALGITDGLLTKYDSAGNYVWYFNFGDTLTNNGIVDLFIDDSNQIYLSGILRGNIDIDPDSVSTKILQTNGSNDFFLAKYSPNKKLKWAFNIGGIGQEQTTSLSISNNNSIYLTGAYTDVVDFDPDTSIYNLTAQSSSLTVNTDVFLMKLNINCNSYTSLNINRCNSFNWPQTGLTYTISGTYSDTLVNSFGCDSIINLVLTINNSSNLIVPVFACDSFTWSQTGRVYLSSGTYSDTLVNSFGCDSIINLVLTINNSSNLIVPVFACDSFTWSQTGRVYLSSGTYSDTLVNSFGCDSIINLVLTLNFTMIPAIVPVSKICVNTVAFNFVGTPAGGNWSGPGITSTGLFNPNISGVGFHPIIYSLTNLCGGSDTTFIQVLPLPIINSNIKDDECDEGIGFITTNVTIVNPPYSYLWGNGQTTTNLINLKKGNYNLAVIDSNGCRSSLAVSIINFENDSCEDTYLFIPNIFSPDGNGNNDVLFADGKNINNISFLIFNRWGNLVFESQSLNQGWDGFYKGKEANVGVYVYYAKGNFNNGDAFEKKGSITLVR